MPHDRLILDPHSVMRKAGDHPLIAVYKADAKQSDYEYLHNLADKYAPEVRAAFLAAIAKMRTFEISELVDALQNGSVKDALEVLAIDHIVPTALAVKMQPALEDEFIDAGRATVAKLPKDISLNMRFDMVNPRSVAFLQSYDFGMIKGITNQTKDAIRQVVTNAFTQGGNPRQQAIIIRDMIGLSQPQATAVGNFNSALIAEQRDPDQIARMVAAYQKRMLTLRANSIARTETIRAASAGQDAAWHPAADEGFLSRAKVRRFWIVTPDDRLCPFCAAIPLLNPAGVALGGYFRSPLGPIDYPPLHPMCRCALILGGF